MSPAEIDVVLMLCRKETVAVPDGAGYSQVVYWNTLEVVLRKALATSGVIDKHRAAVVCRGAALAVSQAAHVLARAASCVAEQRPESPDTDLQQALRTAIEDWNVCMKVLADARSAYAT